MDCSAAGSRVREGIEMSRKKKRLDLYWPLLIIFILVLTAVAVYGLSLVWDYAEAYELAQPEKALDPYIESLTKDRWREIAAPTLAMVRSDIQTEDECFDFIYGLIGEEYSYTRKSANNAEGTVTYTVSNPSRELGTVTIKKTPDPEYSSFEKFSFLNLENYSVVSENYDFSFIFGENKITVPTEYSVWLGDSLVSEDYIIERDIQYPYLSKFYDQVGGVPTLVSYRVDNIFGSSAFTVKDESGQVFDYDESQGPDQFIKDSDENTKNGFNEFVTQFASDYATFTSNFNQSPMNNYAWVERHLVKGTDLQKKLEKARDNMIEDASFFNNYSCKVDFVTLNKAVKITDNYYILDVSYQTSEYSQIDALNADVHLTNLMMLVTNTSGTWLIENFIAL